MYNGGTLISSGNRTESRQPGAAGRQQSGLRQGKRTGHHRGLRAGHVCKRVIRELGRTSRLLGSNRRTTGDRHNQHPGVCCWPQTADEPTLAHAGRNTKLRTAAQGTGRKPKAHRPGRTKVVVATRSTAGTVAARLRGRKRGERRPKGPTIQAARRREGEAGHDLWAREIQE